LVDKPIRISGKGGSEKPNKKRRGTIKGWDRNAVKTVGGERG